VIVTANVSDVVPFQSRGGVRTAGSGNYQRSDDGVWRYTFEILRGEPVPGAADVTLADLAGAVVDGGAIAITSMAILAHPLELGWVRRHLHAQLRDQDRLLDVYLVPADVWEPVAGVAVDMVAPEVHASRLRDLRGAAHLLEVPVQALQSDAFPRRYPPFPTPVIPLSEYRGLYAAPPLLAWAAHFGLGGRRRGR
jgi:hypothetical protein